ncbi:hypothetical protein B0H13DRAFT_1898821 [Mycena leptocephala]|nr:hypothetical protein B0H13DRAFT_1898821 [Mycena leptocephala]
MPEAEMDNGALSSESTEETDLKQTVPDRDFQGCGRHRMDINTYVQCEAAEDYGRRCHGLEALILPEIEGDGEYVNPSGLWPGISLGQAKHAGFGLALAWLWLKHEKKRFVF